MYIKKQNFGCDALGGGGSMGKREKKVEDMAGKVGVSTGKKNWYDRESRVKQSRAWHYRQRVYMAC